MRSSRLASATGLIVFGIVLAPMLASNRGTPAPSSAAPQEPSQELEQQKEGEAEMSTRKSKLCVAAVQMRVTTNTRENFEKIKSYIQKAAKAGIELVVFPECALSGYGPNYKSMGDIDKKLLKQCADEVKQLAGKQKIFIFLGTSEFSQGGWHNIASLISDKGRILGRYSKVQLTGGDAKCYQPGNSLPVFKVKGIPVAAQICYDWRFPEPCRLLALKGAKVICHLANAGGSDTWKVPVIEGHLRSRAAENGIFIVAANAAGPLQMARSHIIDPNGLLLASANMAAEEMITAELDLSKVSRKFIDLRRTDLYELKEKKSAAR